MVELMDLCSPGDIRKELLKGRLKESKKNFPPMSYGIKLKNILDLKREFLQGYWGTRVGGSLKRKWWSEGREGKVAIRGAGGSVKLPE